MAKNFPYFKFTVSEWMTGDIVFEDFSTQGLFINICALYWQRDGNLSIEDINKRYKNPIDLPKLTGRFIEVNNGLILIKFLDEQLIDAGHISKVNSENGKLGGRPRKGNKPTANRPLTDRKAKKSKEEKEQEKELNISFDTFWNIYNKKINSKDSELKWNKLNDSDRQKIINTLPSFLSKITDKQFQPHPVTYLNQKRWNDELPVLEHSEESNEDYLTRKRKERDEYDKKTNPANL